MNEETKVGLFVLIGMILFGTAIFLLGDFSFQTYYPLYVEFKDVAGLPDKSIVKLSGVEVGKIKKIYLKDDKVVVKLAILDGVKIYRDAKFLVGSTSIIGSKFLQVDQGNAAFGALRPDDTVRGDDSLPLDRALAQAITDMQGLIRDLRGDGGLQKNFQEILNNLREVTAGLSEIVTTSQPHAERTMAQLDSLTGRLDRVLAQAEQISAKINNGDGTVGALVGDKATKENVTQTLNNLKDASASVKDVLGRMTAFRTYWNWDWKYEPLAEASKNNIGMKIYPRDGKYYYIGGANIINTKDVDKGVDYETRNTVDAYMGLERGPLEVYFGAIHGTGGTGVKYRPFHFSPAWGRLSALFEVSELTRNRRIKGRFFNDARYDAGLDFRFNKYFSAGMRVNDIAEVKRVNYTTKLLFEDKDISYLFGLVTVGAAGTKGRSN